MADSAVAITAGSGTNIDTRTEATNGDHRQVMVIGDPSTTAGVAPVDGTYGVASDVKRIAAGETHLGEVGGSSTTISVTPTVSTSPAYTAGDAAGGKQTLSNAARVSAGVVFLQSLVITDKGNKKNPFDILFFDSDPTAATITDNSAFVFSTDISKWIGRISVAAADYTTIDSKALVTLRNLGLELKPTGTSLYVAVVIQGTAAYASTSDLIFLYGLLRD